jgi:hypothetical protein
LALEDALVILRARWQLEVLFKLWKQHGLIDEWRTKKRWRILCELYGKLMAMVIQHWLIQHGLWHEPHRSLVKAARRVRRWAHARLEGLVGTQSFAQVLTRLVRSLRSGCRLDTRSTSPTTSHLLLGGLDWTFSSCLWARTSPRPSSGRTSLATASMVGARACPIEPD